MNPGEMLSLLIETTVATSVALLLALLVRQPLRQACGATVGYASWLLVPVAFVAVLLPATTAVPAAPSVSMVLTLGNAIPQTLAAGAVDGVGYAGWWCAIWLAGALGMVAHLAAQQRRFMRGLGRLQPYSDGVLQADAEIGLPAALGLCRPRIVVPADFDLRYSAEQRRVMHAHERAHIRYGDLHLNALVALARCVFWFNPLLHAAARRFRHDQELACDQRVIARHPQSRRAYGEAMFKTQLAAQPLPLGCHWLAFERGRSHPLKERISMLKQPAPSASRWIAGSALVTALTFTAGFAAWAAQPPAPSEPAAPSVPAAPPAPPNVEAVPAPPAPPAAPGALDAPRPPAPPAPDAAPAPPAPPGPPAPPPALAAPPYPAEALAQRVSGKVVLLIDVGADGRPTAIEVGESEPAGIFDAPAIKAAWQWKFSPAVENGNPTASRVSVPVEFRAPGKGSAEAGADNISGMDLIDLNALEATAKVSEVSCDAALGRFDSQLRLCGVLR